MRRRVAVAALLVAAACGTEVPASLEGAAQAGAARRSATARATEGSDATARRLPCTVARVSDGDTIRCREGNRRVRLLDIDAPEMDQRPHGEAARRALLRLVPEGARVALEPGPRPRDQYGRTLAYVWAGDTLLVNAALVRAGFALRYEGGDPGPQAAAIGAAESAARRDAAGLWATGGFSCTPYAHRRKRC